MDLFNAQDLTKLADDRGGVRVSMFLPTHRGGPPTDRNRIRLKNLVRHAEQALRHDGTPTAEIETILAPVRNAQDLTWLWDRPSDGLVVFLSPSGIRHVRVPTRLPELVTVGNRFMVRPLLPLLTAGGHFYVLALNQDDIRLFRGTRFGVDEVALDGLALAMWATMPRRRPQVHAYLADRGGTGGRAVFHGSSDDTTPSVLQHFRRVDQALREVLDSDDAPLVLAGVRTTQALYHQINTHPQLLGAGVDGNPRNLSPKQLHQRAWPLVEPVLRSGEVAAADAYRALSGSGRTCNDPYEILAVAEQGRIETLFLRSDATAWRADVNAGPLIRLDQTLHPAERLDLAAMAVLRHGGFVYTVSRTHMPDTTPAAATLRY